ncbi:MAG: SpoIID/LytB domain-containing protein [Clostridiaceae bacterium]|jgi:stage II sporulation protein D|nr:SpoIID/LytB domain-containing protein [Clostridiaceae bacterium]
MSKKLWRSVAAIIVICFVFMSFQSNEAFAKTYPEIIRVGLYSGSASASSVALSANSGHEIGYYKDNKFVTLLTEKGGAQSIFRKDAYFIKSSAGVISEYDPNEGMPFEGETYGPYHIQIGNNVADLAAAQKLCSDYRASGVIAYPVFEDGWSVWTGFYSDSDKANKDISSLASKLGGISLKVIDKSASRIIVYNSNFEPLLIFGDKNLKLTIRPDSSNNPRLISVNSKPYRGEIELRRFSDSDMTVINIVNIEQYLYGVVPREIESYAPMEALKAQAVAARTFAYRSMGSYKKWDFDVVNTVSSQVYGGYNDEKATTNQAVDETKGKKALYNGNLISMHYFSSSGGRTEDNIYVWGSDIPYLKSVEDPYEAGNSYNYNWSRTFTAEDIKMKLFISGVEIGDIVTMVADEYTPAGRVNKLRIVGTKGSITYSNEDIRIILGDNGSYLPSRMFTINSSGSGTGSGTASVISADGKSTLNVYGNKAVTSSGVYDILSTSGPVKVTGSDNTAIITGNVPSGTFVLTGKGWGHAIGMSQEGAKGLARNGYTYDQILKHYFTGITVE